MKKSIMSATFLFITILLLIEISIIQSNTITNNGIEFTNNNYIMKYNNNSLLSNNQINNGIYIISDPLQNNYLLSNKNSSMIKSKGTDNEKWYIEKFNNKYYKISSYNDNTLVLELDTNNNTISINKYNNSNNQKWKIINNENGTYSLFNMHNNKIIKNFKLINITNTKENTDRIPVFTFHRIVSDELKHSTYEDDQWVESVKAFEKQIKYLSDNGYKTISMDEFYCWYNQNCIFDNKTIMITFDDGNLEDYYLVLPILKKYNIKATTFIVGKRTLDGPIIFDENNRQYLTKDIIKKVKKEYPNWEFQSHTYDMHSITNGRKKIQDMTEEEIKNDFDNQEIFKFSYLAYPYGEYNDYIQEELKKHNYKLAFTFRNYEYATRTFTPYEIPRIKINGYSTVEDLKQWLNY